MPMAGSSIMFVTTSLFAVCGAIQVMMEIIIICHACKLASVSDTQAFETEDELLSHVSPNRTREPTCAVVFEDMLSDEGVCDSEYVYDLKYKIRISNRWFFTALLFPDLSWQEYEGEADNICNKYII